MTTKPDKGSYERQVRGAFQFLESRNIAPFRNCRMDDDDFRDAYVGCTFENAVARIGVGYSWHDLGMSVSVYLRRDDLTRPTRTVYLEPWIEYLTEGETTPVVAFFYPTSSKFKPILDNRRRLFERDGLLGVLRLLAVKLEEHYSRLVGASNDEVLRYQSWFQAHS